MLFLTFLIIPLFLTHNVLSQQPCTKITIRKAFHLMTQEEKQRLFDAIRQLHAQENHISTWERYSQLHLRYSNEIHGTAKFFVWHRYYLYDLEKQLQTIDPELFIPYWAWENDASDPRSSVVFYPENAGGNGSPNTRCVVNGVQANWPVRFLPGGTISSPRTCLQRRFDNNLMYSWYGQVSINNAINRSTTYDGLRNLVEGGGMHSIVHVGVGGHMSTMTSTLDFLFLLHHAKVDQIYDSWQKLDPRERITNYQGGNNDGSTARTTDPLEGFNATVADALDATALCYQYQYPATSTTPLTMDNPALQKRDSEVVEGQYVFAEYNGEMEEYPLIQRPIHMPPRIPTEHIQMFGYDIDSFRANEDKNIGYIEEVNRVNGFVDN